MKKILKMSFLTLLAVPALIGCNGGNKKDGGVDVAAKQAIAQIGVYYGQYAGSNGIYLDGAKLIKQYTVGEYDFDITYSVAPKGEAYTIEYVKIKDDRLEVEIPTFAELNPAGGETVTYASYVLNAKLANKGKELQQQGQWNLRVNAEETKPIWEPISQARLKTTDQTVVTTGYVVAFMNDKQDSEYSNGVWIADGQDGMMLYGGVLASYFGALHIGDVVLIAGPASPYNGLFEVKPKVISVQEEAPEGVNQPDFRVVNEAALNAMTAVNCSDPVTFENVTITTDVDGLSPAAAMTIDIKVGEKSISIYVNKHTATSDREALVTHLKNHKGETVTVKSIMGYNAGKLQITAAVINEGGNLNDMFIFAPAA